MLLTKAQTQYSKWHSAVFNILEVIKIWFLVLILHYIRKSSLGTGTYRSIELELKRKKNSPLVYKKSERGGDCGVRWSEIEAPDILYNWRKILINIHPFFRCWFWSSMTKLVVVVIPLQKRKFNHIIHRIKATL